MSLGVTHLVQEMDTLIAEVREILRSLASADQKERQKKLNECDACIRQFKTTKEALLLEARSLNDEQKRHLEQTVKRRLTIFKDLCEEVEEKKSEMDRNQLEYEAESYDPALGQAPTAQQQVQQLAQQGDRIQDQTEEAITRMKGLVTDAEQVGLATAAKMDEQMEQMGRIGENLNDVEYNTKRAKQTANQMARNATHDKCIQVLCGSILVCLIIIIVLVNV